MRGERGRESFPSEVIPQPGRRSLPSTAATRRRAKRSGPTAVRLRCSVPSYQDEAGARSSPLSIGSPQACLAACRVTMTYWVQASAAILDICGDLGYMLPKSNVLRQLAMAGSPSHMHCASRPFFAERMARGGRSTDTAIRLTTPREMPSLQGRTSGPCRSRSDAAYGPHRGHRLRFLMEQRPLTGLCPRSHD